MVSIFTSFLYGVYSALCDRPPSSFSIERSSLATTGANDGVIDPNKNSFGNPTGKLNQVRTIGYGRVRGIGIVKVFSESKGILDRGITVLGCGGGGVV